MLAFHQEHKADITMAVSRHNTLIPFGVVQAQGVRVSRIVEKPSIEHLINAGIYLLEPSICARIPRNQYLDMPNLIAGTIAAGGIVVSFPLHEYWIDIGTMDDYQRAVEAYSKGTPQ